MEAHIVVEERNVAFQNRIQTFSLINYGHIFIDEFFGAAFNHFEEQTKIVIELHYIVKLSSCFCAVFEKIIHNPNNEGGVEELREYQTIYVHTNTLVVDFETDLEEFYNEYIVDFVKERIDDIQLRGSGFNLSEIKELIIQISRFEPIAGSSYIDLPKFLKTKKAIINVQNKDNRCFKYAVLSALFPASKDAQRVSKYKPFEHLLDFNCVQFPVELRDITKFEEKNPLVSINVYMFDSDAKIIRSLRLTKEIKQNHIHLLLLTKTFNEAEFGVYSCSHYCWIKDLGALIGRQTSKNCRRKMFCDRCLNYFVDRDILNSHIRDCMIQNECMIEMPTKEKSKIKFCNYKKQLEVPFIIYADLESILKKPDEQFCRSKCNEQNKKTEAYQQHVAHSIGYYFKCSYDDAESYYRSKRDENCITWFVKELNNIAEKFEPILNNVKPLRLNADIEASFAAADECYICKKKYTATDIRVRDHSHLSGIYRGSAHSDCNLQHKESRHIPVIFHNLSNYDAHFLIKELSNGFDGPISIVPQTDQLYISFTKTATKAHSIDYANFIKFRFIDSFRFMPSSLDYLSSILPSEKKKILHTECQAMNPTQIALLERKGVFCYDYVDSWEKLNETKLPNKASFYSRLTESEISDEDYDFACRVWDEFEIKTLGQYSDLYLKTDILLLSDVFENFRETCYAVYNLDAAHYFTAPGLSFDAMLKYTQVEIELLTDIDMLLFVERGIRGGISQCSKRHSKANNRFMNDYDMNTETKFLVYLDANNLYGYSMMQHLPINNFKWNMEMFTEETILNLADDGPTGYIFEVDLHYPQSLHDKHADYPLCAENRIVPGSKNEKKLLLTLYDKKKYVIHFKMLKFVLQQGMKLMKIHRVMEFSQSTWLKPYIDLNTDLRTKANNDFEKDFYKLLINAIYGKTMENVRARVDISLKTTWDGRFGARKLIALPNFKKYNIFDENLVAIHMNKVSVLMDKPVTIGMAILDISKVHMYDFYYNHIQDKYNKNVQMIYTDTDSLILEVKTPCFYTDMLHSLEKYDTSNYTDPNEYNIPRRNKKVPGLFKDELSGLLMTEFVGLRSKMYCVKCGEIEKKKKAKGVKKYVLKKTITFEDYMRCIRDNCSIVRQQNSFRSKNHTVYTISQEKIALSPSDNKRYILENKVDTLPWGHYKIPL